MYLNANFSPNRSIFLLKNKKNAPQMAIVYKRQNFQSNTMCTLRHDKENNLL